MQNIRKPAPKRQENARASGRIIVIGELNLDLVASGLPAAPVLGNEIIARDFRMTLGSASAIFASGMARLGHPVTFVSKVGDDELGRASLRALQNAGIWTEHVMVAPGSTTGVTISLSTGQDRALVTCLGAIAEQDLGDVPLDLLNGHAHLHMTSIFLQHALRPAFPVIFRKARGQGLTTSFDPNSDPSQSWAPGIWDVISQTDLLFVNETEALQLTRERDVQNALASLGRKAPCVVIKRGALGAMGIMNGEIVSSAGFPVPVVDTTGAGDSFAAGFVHAYLEGSDLPGCLEAGNACGALSTLRVGGTPGQPTSPELATFLDEQRRKQQSARHACGQS